MKPEKKRCYICGSTKHTAGEYDRPNKDDPPPTKGNVLRRQRKVRQGKVKRQARRCRKRKDSSDTSGRSIRDN